MKHEKEYCELGEFALSVAEMALLFWSRTGEYRPAFNVRKSIADVKRFLGLV